MNGDLHGVFRELGIPDDYATRRRLVPHAQCDEQQLVEIGTNPDGQPVRLRRDAASAWFRMHTAAAQRQISLVPESGFRSVSRQIAIIREKLAAGARIDDILRTVAAPGYSEHHTGCAIDVGSPEHIELDEDFALTAAFRWLEEHAGEFGFRLSYPRDNPHGIGYEPWHWCWHPSA